MGFSINFSQHGKIQQNPAQGENLGNWQLYFSHSMDNFFPSNSHSMVHFIMPETHGFSHEFYIIRENVTKPIILGGPGKLVPIIFPYYGCFFSYSIPILWYTSLRGKYMDFPISFPQQEKMQQIPLYVEDQGSYVSHSTGAFFALDSHLMALFIRWEICWFFNQFSIAWQNSAKGIKWAEPG